MNYDGFKLDLKKSARKSVGFILIAITKIQIMNCKKKIIYIR